MSEVVHAGEHFTLNSNRTSDAAAMTAVPFKILIFSAKPWAIGGHIAIALAKAGAVVAVLAPKGSPIHAIRSATQHFMFRRRLERRSLRGAIEEFAPHLVVCADDFARRWLCRLHADVVTVPNDHELAALIEDSLGDAANYHVAQSMTMFIELARRLGLRCPDFEVFENDVGLNTALSHCRFPIILKGDGYTGGGGVKVLRRPDEKIRLVGELLQPISWSRSLRRMLAPHAYSLYFKHLAKWPHRMCLQSFVAGRPANRAVFCWRGEILAGVSVVAIETVRPFGPSSIVRIIDNPDMERAAQVLVAHLGLSGFIGFDFMLDSGDRAFLLEMNPRLTPISHIPTERGDLVTALIKKMTGRAPSAPRAPIMAPEIALFPQELSRMAGSPYFQTAHHDVPWHETAYVARALESL